MRLSIISALALILPLQASAEVGVASPSLFAVRKNAPTPKAAVFGIPRGGAGAVAPAKAPVAKAPAAKATSINGGAMSLPSDIFSKEKLPWTISLAINVAYVFFFMKKFYSPFANEIQLCGVEKAGFCVTNMAGCAEGSLMNSHIWAFLVDMYFTYRGFVVPTNRSKLAKYFLISSIFSHGLLHGALGSPLAKCGMMAIEGGEQIFMVFAGFISFAVLQVGSNIGLLMKLILSAVSGWLTLKLAGPGGDNGVSSIFIITQIIASLSSVFAPSGAFKNFEEMGWGFVPPCVISLIEFLYCCDGSGASLFNKLGGHVWYDLFLHRSVILAIQNGADKE